MPHPSLNLEGFVQGDYVQKDIDRAQMNMDPFERAQAEFMDNDLLDLRDERTTVLPDEDSPCPICYDTLEVTPGEGPDDPMVIVGCGHIFHLGCLWDWLDSPAPQITTCPMCRRGLFPNPKYTGDWDDVPNDTARLLFLAEVAHDVALADASLARARARSDVSDVARARLAEAVPLAAQMRPLFARYRQLTERESALVDRGESVPKVLNDETEEVYDTLEDLMFRVQTTADTAEATATDTATDTDTSTAESTPTVANAEATAAVPTPPEDVDAQDDVADAPVSELSSLAAQWSPLWARFMQLQHQAGDLLSRGEPVPDEMDKEIDQSQETLLDIRRRMEAIAAASHSMWEL